MRILWLGLEHNLGIEKEHEVIIMNKNTWSYEKVRDFNPDVVIEREFNDGKNIYTEEMLFVKNKLLDCKTAIWFIDTHVSFDRHIKYASLFDYKFLAISEYVPAFLTIYKDVFWLPVCFPLSSIPKHDVKREYVLGFVGRWKGYERRSQLLDALRQRYADLCHFVTDYETVYQTMAKCHIMVNYSFKNDMNYRVFEALGMGNILVTNAVPDIFRISELSERMYIYNTIDGAIALIDLILKNKTDIDTKQNISYIEEGHTLKQRIEAMLGMVKNKLQMGF